MKKFREVVFCTLFLKECIFATQAIVYEKTHKNISG